ncbi:hypothetical protein [Streptomyces sp. E1N211]|uniref:hypothetical protein n=1 Tax=Streptomyces sp. E1N211 TaxID=1851876 RepID=UPI000EF650B7|nr:hypothetical protein [Streptomyces sp. E1N211]
MAITLDKPNTYLAITNGDDTDVIAVEPMPATDAEMAEIYTDAMDCPQTRHPRGARNCATSPRRAAVGGPRAPADGQPSGAGGAGPSEAHRKGAARAQRHDCPQTARIGGPAPRPPRTTAPPRHARRHRGQAPPVAPAEEGKPPHSRRCPSASSVV